MADGIGGTDAIGIVAGGLGKITVSYDPRERVTAWHDQLPRAVQLRILPDDRALCISYGEGIQTISWSDVTDPKTWTTSGASSMPAEDFRKAVIYLPPRYAMSDLPAYAFPKWSIGS